MFKQPNQLIVIALDLLLVGALWIFNLDTEFALSVLIFQLIMSLGVFLMRVIISQKSSLTGKIINIFFGLLACIFFYFIVNVIHHYIPNSKGSHIRFIIDALRFDQRYESLSYLIITAIVTSNFVGQVLSVKDSIDPFKIYQEVYFTVYKIFIFIMAATIAMQFYIDHPKQEVGNIPEFSRLAMTFTILSFAILDYLLILKLKRRNS